MRAEIAADLALAAEDRLADHRRADHLAVQHDGEGLADMLGREIGETLGTGEIELEMHRPAAHVLVEQGRCVFEICPVQRDLFADIDRLPLMPRFGIGKPLGRRPAIARLGADQMEAQLRRRAEQALDPSRIGNAGKLDDDPPLALPGDDRLIDAGFVHPAPHDRDRLGDGVIRQRFHGIVVQRQRAPVAVVVALQIGTPRAPPVRSATMVFSASRAAAAFWLGRLIAIL